MSVVIPDATLNDLLTDTQVNKLNWRVVLFQNNYTPVAGSAWANLTEATFSGYARVTPTWGSPSVTSHVSSSASSTATFSHSGGATSNSIYGWALIDTTPGTPEILAADVIAGAPISMGVSGDQITVTLTETAAQA